MESLPVLPIASHPSDTTSFKEQHARLAPLVFRNGEDLVREIVLPHAMQGLAREDLVAFGEGSNAAHDQVVTELARVPHDGACSSVEVVGSGFSGGEAYIAGDGPVGPVDLEVVSNAPIRGASSWAKPRRAGGVRSCSCAYSVPGA